MANKTEFYVSAATMPGDVTVDYTKEFRGAVGVLIPNFDSVTAAKDAEDPSWEGKITYLKVTVEEVGAATRAADTYVFAPFDTEGRD